MFEKSTDKEKVSSRPEYTLNKAIELDPTPVAYAAIAMNSLNVFQTSCDEVLKDTTKAENLENHRCSDHRRISL